MKFYLETSSTPSLTKTRASLTRTLVLLIVLAAVACVGFRWAELKTFEITRESIRLSR